MEYVSLLAFSPGGKARSTRAIRVRFSPCKESGVNGNSNSGARSWISREIADSCVDNRIVGSYRPFCAAKITCMYFCHTRLFKNLEEYFAGLAESHFHDGINKLEDRWTKCIDFMGDYTEQ